MATGQRHDLVVAGGGVAGLILATSTVRTLGAEFRVSVHDPALAGRSGDANIRAYALSPAAVAELQRLEVWPEIADEAQAINEMIVTDSATGDPVRPVLLRFDGEGDAGLPLAHMIRENALISALQRAALAGGATISKLRVASCAPAKGCRLVELSDGSTARASLVVAADGQRSRLREREGIAFYGWDYGQHAIVATVRHERGHEGRAEEHFLPAGPFAILPMRAPDGSDTCSSIVWTESKERALRLAGLDGEQFDAALEEKFGLHLGGVKAITRPDAYPLSFGIARRFHGERLALLGDAARVIHPLAGQGLNLGIADAVELARLVTDRRKLGLDIGDAAILSDYDRARRFDSMAMAATTDLLNRLFSNDATGLRALRDLGLGVVDRSPAFKRMLMQAASGRAPQVSSSIRRASSGSMIGMPSRIG